MLNPGPPQGGDRAVHYGLVGPSGPELTAEQREFAVVVGRLLAERWDNARSATSGSPPPEGGVQEGSKGT